MTSTIIWIHLAAAAIALPLAVVMLARRKGDRLHRFLGRVWVVLMVFVSVTSFWITEINTDRWSPIHILSFVTLLSLAYAVYAIRKGNVRGHRIAMINSSIGLGIAFAFTFLPSRLMSELLF